MDEMKWFNRHCSVKLHGVSLLAEVPLERAQTGFSRRIADLLAPKRPGSWKKAREAFRGNLGAKVVGRCFSP